MYPDKIIKRAEKLEVTPEVYLYLRRSNRKIRYFTYDLKTEKILIDGERITIIPEREDSYDRLEKEYGGVATEEASVEDIVIALIMREQLREAFALLSAGEQQLIQKIFYEDRTEEEVAQSLGITQQAVSKRIKRVSVDKNYHLDIDLNVSFEKFICATEHEDQKSDKEKVPA